MHGAPEGRLAGFDSAKAPNSQRSPARCLCDCFRMRRLSREPIVRKQPSMSRLRGLSFDLLPVVGTPTPPDRVFAHTPDEAEAVEVLRTHLLAFLAVNDLPAPREVLSEQRLLRYVRFIDEPTAECERMVRMRSELGMDATYDRVAQGLEWPAERQMAAVWQHNLFSERLTDREGRPLFLASIGGLSCTRLLFQAVPPATVRAHLHHCLELLNQTISAQSEQQRTLLSWTYVLDLSGFSLWQAAGSEQSRSFFKRLGEEANRLAVPHQIARILLVHAPAQWQLVWKAAVLIMPPRVQRKAIMLADPADLLQHIHPAMLPRRFHGHLPDESVFAPRAFGASGDEGADGDGGDGPPERALLQLPQLQRRGSGHQSKGTTALH